MNRWLCVLLTHSNNLIDLSPLEWRPMFSVCGNGLGERVQGGGSSSRFPPADLPAFAHLIKVRHNTEPQIKSLRLLIELSRAVAATGRQWKLPLFLLLLLCQRSFDLWPVIISPFWLWNDGASETIGGISTLQWNIFQAQRVKEHQFVINSPHTHAGKLIIIVKTGLNIHNKQIE